MPSLREIPEARIKRLVMIERLPDLMFINEDHMRRTVVQRMGHEIAAKLMEFNKIVIRKEVDGVILYRGEIEVIVPPTPKENLCHPSIS